MLRNLYNVNVNSDGHFIFVAATDANSLYEERLVPFKEKFSILVPNTAVTYLSTAPFTEETLSVSFSNSNMAMDDGTTNIKVLLTDSRYINYKAAIPKGGGTSVWKLDKQEFLHRINALSSVYNTMDKYPVIVLNINIKETEMISDSANYNSRGREIVLGTLEGDAIRIGFNPSILKRIIAICEDGEVCMHMTAPNRPLKIETDTRTMISMPLMLSNL